MENLSEDIKTGVSLATINSILNAVVNNAEALCDDISFDFDDFCETALQTGVSMGEGIFKKLTGPFGVALNAIFASAKAENLILETAHFVKNMGKNHGMFVFTPLNSDNTKTDVLKNQDVTIHTRGNLPAESTVSLYKIYGRLDNPIVKDGKEITHDYRVVDITVSNNGETIQPSGTVEVCIDIPEGFSNKLYVMKQNENGVWEQVDSEIKNGVIYFSVDHFCLFAIVDENTEAPVPGSSLPGDADGDGKVTAADARKILRVAAMLEPVTEYLLKVCDVDHNGSLTAVDARRILRVAAKLDTFD